MKNANRENYSCSVLDHDWKVLSPIEDIAQDKICLKCNKEVNDWTVWNFGEKDTPELAKLRKTSIEQTKSRSLFP